MNPFGFLPKATGPDVLEEKSSSRGENSYEIYVFTELKAPREDTGT